MYKVSNIISRIRKIIFSNLYLTLLPITCWSHLARGMWDTSMVPVRKRLNQHVGKEGEILVDIYKCKHQVQI